MLRPHEECNWIDASRVKSGLTWDGPVATLVKDSVIVRSWKGKSLLISRSRHLVTRMMCTVQYDSRWPGESRDVSCYQFPQWLCKR